MPRDFIPRTDGGFNSFAANFAATVAADREAYGLPAELTSQLVDAQTAYAAAYRAAIEPSTRGMGTVAAKDDAREALERFIRLVARIIRGTPTVTAEMRINIGMSPRDAGGRVGRLAAPEAAPLLRVTDVVGPLVSIKLGDRATGKMHKPHEKTYAHIYYAVGEFLEADVHWIFAGGCTGKTAVNLAGAELRPGTRVWFCARWQNTRGLGPCCDPVPARLTDGIVFPTAA